MTVRVFKPAAGIVSCRSCRNTVFASFPDDRIFLPFDPFRSFYVRFHEAGVVSRIAAMTKTRIARALLGFSLLMGGLAIAQPLKRNVSPGRHPNLAATQRLGQNAYEKIIAAQQANEWTCRVTLKRPRNYSNKLGRNSRHHGAGGEAWTGATESRARQSDWRR